MMMNSTLAMNGGRAVFDGVEALPSWPQGGDEEAAALRLVVESGKWGSNHGERTAAFQDRFARFQGVNHATALSNGTLALVAALRACGVGVGDEVIVPPYTFIATASAVLFVGAIPVFADVDLDTHLLDPASAESAITERTKAIIPVHLAGNIADMDAFARMAERYGIAIIEDAAQAVGARWRDRGVGSLGTVGTFSFQSSKNLTAGEGGMVTTQDAEVAKRLYAQINVGRVEGGGWYQHDFVGCNLRITEFQSAVLNVQIEKLADLQRLRAINADVLRKHLAVDPEILIADVDPRVTAHGQHLFIFRVPMLGSRDQRARAVEALIAEGIPASAGYVPLHRNVAIQRETEVILRQLGRDIGAAAECPNADIVSADTIWLPQNVLLGSSDQISAIADGILKVTHAAASW